MWIKKANGDFCGRDRSNTPPAIDRVLAKSIVTESGCIEFTDWKTGRGYGQVRSGTGKGVLLAHRVSYEATNGQIPEGLFVLHKCDNRKCINPDHLFLGTHQENMEDAKHKGRLRNKKTGPLPDKCWI